MSETMKALGMPEPFAWRGRTLMVSPINFRIRGLFSYDCRMRAIQGLLADRELLGESVYRDALQLHKDDLAAGEYEFTGRVCQKALQSDPGRRELAWLCITEARDGSTKQRLNEGWTRELMEELYEDTLPPTDEQGRPAGQPSKWNELLQLINRLNATPPNGQRPSAETAAGQNSAMPT